jgi:hydrogenase maturation protein HypF
MRDGSRDLVRRSVAVSGVVQGVGFRPFVHQLASRHALVGFVRNRAGDVIIEVEGDAGAVDAFVQELGAHPPPLAKVDEMRCTAQPTRGDVQFRIEVSDEGASHVVVAPDAATCDACLRELRDPAARRYRYPFVNCAHCGPRLTIVRGAPYDRERTTMTSFAMCDACRREYDDPDDRRFHAQPIACPACGPKLRALGPGGVLLEGDPIVVAVAAIRAGAIVAVKGVGGYHLACSARDERAVAELRRRKARDEKPFAILVSDLEAAEALCEIGSLERDVLTSPARPIVLLRARPGAVARGGALTQVAREGARITEVARGVAPDRPELGVMLAYAPLHHLLCDELGDTPLVMTSGNRSDEPIAYEDADAIERLSAIADVLLVHDRPIETRCDDSVIRVLPGTEPVVTPIRRSRGYAPAPLALPLALARPTLAVGGPMKATFALGLGRRLVVSHHLGDLDDIAALRAYRTALDHYARLFRIAPVRIVHDAHPDYASTREALHRASDGASLFAVQHHHAHMASCMAENRLTGPAIGVCFDGAGLGDDGAIWGGEVLVGGYARVQRAAHLAYVAMPGGERATREPWRMALAHCHAAGLDPLESPTGVRVSRRLAESMARMIAMGVACPPTSSVGRLFDAVASLVGACDHASFEGQAAMALEALAGAGEVDGAPYAFDVRDAGDGTGGLRLDPAPVIRAVVADVTRGAPPQHVARRFHDGLAAAVADICSRVRASTGVDRVVLSGGVFVNARLSVQTAERLENARFHVHRHRVVPPNDGGLCLGQLAVLAAVDAGGEKA